MPSPADPPARPAGPPAPADAESSGTPSTAEPRPTATSAHPAASTHPDESAPADASAQRDESTPPAASARPAIPETLLRIRGLSVGFGGPPIIEGIDLDVGAGQFVSLIGPSGSGKTSILRVVTGLLEPRQGTVDLGVALGDVGFLFQDDALLPWRTARQNVALGLRIRDVPPSDADARADHWLATLGLAGYGDRFPAQLSGGQRKRVAIAQVLALRPRLLLMDEPFAALDAIVRTRITQELLDWVERDRLTVLLVTHDLEEAICASDAVAVLGHGPRAAMRARHAVDIPRPRDVLDAKRHPAFGPLLRTLWNDLTAEAPPSPATGGETPGKMSSPTVDPVEGSPSPTAADEAPVGGSRVPGDSAQGSPSSTATDEARR